MIYSDNEYDKQRAEWIIKTIGHNENQYHKKYKKRIDQFAEYIIKWDVKSVVFGLSGGIDSAFVLDIVYTAIKKYNLELTAHVVFFTHGLHDYEATFSDTQALQERVLNSDLKKNFYFHQIDLQPQVDIARDFLGHNRNILAQYAYSLMYTSLFGVAQRYNGITLGSTNKDEMGFIGWFGKNSDMVVDLQLISDFHKIELNELCVLQLTETVPTELVRKPPTGNIISGRTDEEVFGHSYTDVGFITHLYLTHGLESFSVYLKQRFASLIELHEKNAHKYQGQGFNPVFLKD